MATAPSLSPANQSGNGAGPARPAWMNVDWRKHQRWVQVHGRPVNVIELGDGPPVVFVHGLSGCWQNWLEQLPAFAADHRVIALDLPGFGYSPMPRQKITIGAYADTVGRVCEQLGVEHACLVGNSMGGFVSAELAITAPARVERLVLVAAAGLTSNQMRNEPGLAALRRLENVMAFYTGWLASRSDTVARRPGLRRATLSLVAHDTAAMHPALVAEQLRGSGKPGFVDALDTLTAYPIADRLGSISCPTLIVWGAKDRLVPLRDASEFERAIGGSRKVIFDEAGHVPMLEQPARFNAELAAFLTE